MLITSSVEGEDPFSQKRYVLDMILNAIKTKNFFLLSISTLLTYHKLCCLYHCYNICP